MADKTTKHLTDDLKQFFENINKKLDELTQRLQEMDCKVSETTKLSEDNKRQIDYLA